MRAVQKGVRFSRIEIEHLAKSIFFISLAFTIVTEGMYISMDFFYSFLVFLFAAGLGFLLHELAHKFLAQRYGCWSEFRSNSKMLWLAVILAAVVRVVFIAPGAVLIHGSLTKSENGKISAAGPATNLSLAILFLVIGITYPLGFIGSIGSMGFFLNTWMALFNMIPFHPFDGRKILSWNKAVYFGMVSVGVLLMAIVSL